MSDRTLNSGCRAGRWTPTATCSCSSATVSVWSRRRGPPASDRRSASASTPSRAVGRRARRVHPGVFATAGMHPHDASAIRRPRRRRDREAARDPAGGRRGGVRARLLPHALAPRRPGPGPAGRTSRWLARPTFRSSSTSETRGPRSFDCSMRVRRNGRAPLLHAATRRSARECVARGYWPGFAGNITYPKNAHFRRGGRGDRRRSHPRRDRQSVPRAAEDARTRQRTRERHATIGEIARVRGDDVDAIVEATAKNARAAFVGLP